MTSRIGQYKNHGRAERYFSDLRKRCAANLKDKRLELLDQRRKMSSVESLIRSTAAAEFPDEELDDEMVMRLQVELLQDEYLELQQDEDRACYEANFADTLECPSCKSRAILDENFLYCANCRFAHRFSETWTPDIQQLDAWLIDTYKQHETSCSPILEVASSRYADQPLQLNCPFCGFEKSFVA